MIDLPLVLQSPDGYEFHVEESVDGQSRVAGISIRISSQRYEDTVAFYRLALGYEPVENTTGDKPRRRTRMALHDAKPSDTWLELLEIENPVDHAKAIGRLALAVPTSELDSIQTVVETRTKGSVHTPRIALDTPGKATVEVLITLDPEGFEICTVGAEAFYELCGVSQTPCPIDWAQRKENGSKE